MLIHQNILFIMYSQILAVTSMFDIITIILTYAVFRPLRM